MRSTGARVRGLIVAGRRALPSGNAAPHQFCSHTARAGERLSSAGCFSLVLTASSLPDSGSQATVAAPPYCERPETDGFRAEVEENGILGFEDIEGAKGEEGAWEGCVGKEVGPGTWRQKEWE